MCKVFFLQFIRFLLIWGISNETLVDYMVAVLKTLTSTTENALNCRSDRRIESKKFKPI